MLVVEYAQKSRSASTEETPMLRAYPSNETSAEISVDLSPAEARLVRSYRRMHPEDMDSTLRFVEESASDYSTTRKNEVRESLRLVNGGST